MKRILMSVVLFAVSAPAFALDLPGVKLPTPEAKMSSAAPVTAFAQLAAVFMAGTAVTEADLTGYHSGRRYYEDSPNCAFPEILVGRRITTTDLPADLAPPAAFGIFTNHPSMSSLPADYFDKLTAEKKASIAESTFTPVKFGTEEVSVIYPKSILTVRKSGNYLIAKIDEYGKTAKAYCYFFLKAQ